MDKKKLLFLVFIIDYYDYLSIMYYCQTNTNMVVILLPFVFLAHTLQLITACSNGMQECRQGRGSDDGFVLYMLDDSAGALCLDGSPGGFYFRRGRGQGDSLPLRSPHT